MKFVASTCYYISSLFKRLADPVAVGGCWVDHFGKVLVGNKINTIKMVKFIQVPEIIRMTPISLFSLSIIEIFAGVHPDPFPWDI